MFQGVLKEVVDAADRGVASLIMDLEGIALDSYSRPDAKFDIKTIGIELSVVIKSVRQASSMLDAGEAHEVSIMADQLVTLVRMVNEYYFLALSLEPGGNVGKARYVLRTRAPQVAADLA
jgi:predicted regulator of Ras-like GTPase activity (Roadblock/LC7/MglB family)